MYKRCNIANPVQSTSRNNVVGCTQVVKKMGDSKIKMLLIWHFIFYEQIGNEFQPQDIKFVWWKMILQLKHDSWNMNTHLLLEKWLHISWRSGLCECTSNDIMVISWRTNKIILQLMHDSWNSTIMCIFWNWSYISHGSMYDHPTDIIKRECQLNRTSTLLYLGGTWQSVERRMQIWEWMVQHVVCSFNTTYYMEHHSSET